MHNSRALGRRSGTISLSVLFREQDYKQLRIERFRRHITASECLSQALNEMLEDQKTFSEVIMTSQLECNLVSPTGVMKKVRIFLPLEIVIKLNDIYQNDLVGRDQIINQAFCLYAKKRKEAESI